MALKLLQSGKLLSRAFQNLQISSTTSNFLVANQKINPIFSRNYPGFFTKCKLFIKKLTIHCFRRNVLAFIK